MLATGLTLSSVGLADDMAMPGYRLVWGDEFDVDGRPDPLKWDYERGFERNNELQWYQPENATCRGGALIIEGRRERKPNPLFEKGSKDWRKKREFIDYTSACLRTKGLHSWQYGRFDIKARIKTKTGLWPAIWFLGVTGRWPDCGEIDLMEYYNDQILANACWGSDKPGQAKWDSSYTSMKEFNDPQWDQKFHLWRMDWDTQSIKLYVDDRLLNTIDLTRTINPTTDRGPSNPFQQPHYLLINLAIGGNQGGDPTLTKFPTLYEIEYVRVYEKQES